jgi:hypothetical protein
MCTLVILNAVFHPAKAGRKQVKDLCTGLQRRDHLRLQRAPAEYTDPSSGPLRYREGFRFLRMTKLWMTLLT